LWYVSKIMLIIENKLDNTDCLYIKGVLYNRGYWEVMSINKWRQRLANSLEKNGKSKRSVSLAAGMGAGYLHSILVEEKDPTIESLVKICKEIQVSIAYIIYGYNVTPIQEEFLRLFELASPADRQAILTLLRSRNGE